MRAVVQRVSRAEVRAGGQVIGRIGTGLLVFAAIGEGDTPEAAEAFAAKILNLRILNDEREKMNRCLLDTGGEVLCVSQFTLYGDTRHGRRPSYMGAAAPAVAQPLYEKLLETLRALGKAKGIRVEGGRFQTMMEVESVNDGPVTILLDSEKTF
ncbi:MAG TPA: D-aminoacyl-tRNA deacylase [Terriglobia bacterium]|nr:D-aminoacyl-tRNA deacylase [Terriglobia bacterium]